jgi:hypothetical protein
MDLIFCANDNPLYAQIAVEEGWSLGICSNRGYQGYEDISKISFVDIDYRNPDFERHLAVVGRLQPRYATVPDLSEHYVSESDIERALRQAEQLKNVCALPLIVPKLAGQVPLIPKEWALAYSVRTTYGGANYFFWEEEVRQGLAGRRIHLLGGSPQEQIQIYLHVADFVHISSVDCSMPKRQSWFAEYWEHGRWVKHPKKGQKQRNLPHECWRLSCRHIIRRWRELGAVAPGEETEDALSSPPCHV